MYAQKRLGGKKILKEKKRGMEIGGGRYIRNPSLWVLVLTL